MSIENPFPRVYSTTKIARSARNALFGPFASRAAADRYADEMLNLFLLRRCTENLAPDPAFPGCLYSEMKMCLAPCYKGCTDQRYQEEAGRVFEFLNTRGASLLHQLEAERNSASEALDFEHAAALHQRIQKVESAIRLASDAVRPLSRLNGILVQRAQEPSCVALFRLREGALNGPVFYSIVGMRLANEGSGSTSLFSHPAAIEPVVLDTAAAQSGKNALEQRLEEALRQLERKAIHPLPAQVLSEHLALFTRWFYQPAAKRAGEVIFDNPEGHVAQKALLRAISRVAVKSLSPDVLEASPSNPEQQLHGQPSGIPPLIH